MDSTLAYSVTGACDALGIRRTTLYRLIGEGQIEARQCGGRTLILADSLRAFLAKLPPAPIRKAPAALATGDDQAA
jgi:excisionase family DNA binding protein